MTDASPVIERVRQTDELDEVEGDPEAWVVERKRHHEEPSRLDRLRDWIAEGFTFEVGLTVLVVALMTGYVYTKLGPIWANSTPAGGDMGAHVWGPAFLRDELIPRGRLSGWTPDWYAGFPAYQFYMVVPSVLILFLDVFLPYGVAFKLVVVAGPLAMPAACALFAWMVGFRNPAPAIFAWAGVFFLFDTSYTIYGGNLASTMAGEFAFSLSLPIAIVYLGVAWRGIRTGKHRALAASLLALCGLCHIIPAFFALAATAVFWLVRPGRARPWWRVASIWWVVTMGSVAALLSAFWVVPFAGRRAFVNDMGWERTTLYWENLFPAELRWLVLLALVGVGVSLYLRHHGGIALSILALVTAVAFRFIPDGRLWNARILPFYHLILFFLAAVAVAEGLRLLYRAGARAVASRDGAGADSPGSRAGETVAVLALGSVLALGALAVDFHEPWLPFSHTGADGAFRFAGTTDRQANFIPFWAQWNFSGYEGKPAYREYHDIVRAMDDIGTEHGCGRAMWEYESELDRYGTPMALMLLPFWTDGCIGSMEGLYFEASTTTPYHFLNQDQLSTAPSNAMRDLPYGAGPPTADDFRLGVQHLQLMGVRYYMAFSDSMLEFARAHPDLTELEGEGSPPWTVFQVADSELVAPLEHQPVVYSNVTDGADRWLEPAVAWYQDPVAQEVFWASSGPDDWERLDVGDTAPREPLPPVQVTNVETDTDRISFDVDQIGVPVLVRASYFPNWKVSGGEGPYRVTPNLMVVVPTDTHVDVEYGWTALDIGAWVMTIFGIVGVVVLARLPAVPGCRPVDEAGPDARAEPEAGPDGPPELDEGGPDGPDLGGPDPPVADGSPPDAAPAEPVPEAFTESVESAEL
jgi:hypothetical protein